MWTTSYAHASLDILGTPHIAMACALLAAYLLTKIPWETALVLLAPQDLALLVGSSMPQALRLVFAGATQ